MRKPFNLCCNLFLGLLLAAPLWPQTGGPHVVSAQAVPGLAGKRGSTLEVPLKVTIRPGYHINSNRPAEDYLIPTVLDWESEHVTVQGVTYPKAESVRYEFSEKPLLVYSGTVTIVSRLSVAANAPSAPATLNGKLRYQACTDKMCLAPRTLDVSVPIRIE